MSRDEQLYLDDIAECCAKITRYVHAMSFDQFQTNELVMDAVYRNLEIVGEASKHVEAPTLARMATVDWIKVAGLRNILAHVYFGLDEEVVWDIVQNYVPALWTAVSQVLAGRSGVEVQPDTTPPSRSPEA